MKMNKKINALIVVILSFLVLNCSSGDDGGGDQMDTTPPSIPSNLQASDIAQTSVRLSWSPSTDNIGVSSYSIYNNNTALVSSVNTTTIISGLTEDTSYNFKLTARDAAGNVSGFSSSLSVTTEADNSTLLTASGDIENYIGNLIDTFPGNSGNDYSHPLISELNTWDTVINDILIENISNAVTGAGSLGYQITEFSDTSVTPNQIFYILEKKSNQSNYWGTYVFSKTPVRDNLILMAPHSKYDTNTGKEAVYCFKNTLAKALFINGTHRCNSSSASSCSGTTSACGSSAAYRISDLAHNITSAFQKATENLFNNVNNSVFIQLHGFAKQQTDPYVIMSNGTRETPAIDYATLIKDALIIEDNMLTFKLAHIDTSWDRLIGFTNTQGRLINNSVNHCNSSANSTSGRFIHIEQERTRLRENESGWIKMSNALKSVF